MMYTLYFNLSTGVSTSSPLEEDCDVLFTIFKKDHLL